jgi:hypothetical protein
MWGLGCKVWDRPRPSHGELATMKLSATWSIGQLRSGLHRRRPFVGVSHARSWSRLLVLGAISWAFIAKSYPNL